MVRRARKKTMTVMERRGPEAGCAHNHENVRAIIDNVHTIIGKSDLGKP